MAWLTSNCGRIGTIGSSPSNGLKPNLSGQKGFNPLCQCVYVYVCIVNPDIQTTHICSHTSIHTHIYLYIYLYICLSVYLSICIDRQTDRQTYRHMPTYLPTYLHTYNNVISLVYKYLSLTGNWIHICKSLKY